LFINVLSQEPSGPRQKQHNLQ